MQIDEELTFKKLEIFLAFMRSGNLSRAAAELDTSTVSVHRAIHSLESALRCPLFKREERSSPRWRAPTCWRTARRSWSPTCSTPCA